MSEVGVRKLTAPSGAVKKGPEVENRFGTPLRVNLSNAIWYPIADNECTICFQCPANVSVKVGGESAQGIGNWQFEIKHRLTASNAPSQTMEPHCSYPLEEEFHVTFGEDDQNGYLARGLATLCDSGRAISITLRFNQKIEKCIGNENPERLAESKAALAQTAKTISCIHDARCVGPNDEYSFSIDAAVDVLLNHLAGGVDKKVKTETSESAFWKAATFVRPLHVSPCTGLVVFSGATKSGKTVYSKSFVLRYLTALAHASFQSSPPHLVTYEDPPESWQMNCSSSSNGLDRENVTLSPLTHSALRFGLWFTPRKCKTDVNTLESACKNALRQTPACVYIGEIRDATDWRRALELGATGHLVVTTTHAGSLVETFGRILDAQSAHQAYQRTSVGNALLGVIHLTGKALDYQSLPGSKLRPDQVFPCLWKRTPLSVAALTTDGISSVVADRANVIGRRSMLMQIWDNQQPHYEPAPDDVLQKHLLNVATHLDLAVG